MLSPNVVTNALIKHIGRGTNVDGRLSLIVLPLSPSTCGPKQTLKNLTTYEPLGAHPHAHADVS